MYVVVRKNLFDIPFSKSVMGIIEQYSCVYVLVCTNIFDFSFSKLVMGVIALCVCSSLLDSFRFPFLKVSHGRHRAV